MREQPFLPRRRSVRLPGFDYSERHSYFVTICAQGKRPIFGRIVGSNEVSLSGIGRIVQACWKEIPSHFPNADLATFVVMPEHLHGILILRERVPEGRSEAKVPRRARRAVPLQKHLGDFAAPTIGSIPTIVGAFKSAVSKRVSGNRSKPNSIWQRGYYEHVIWNEDEFAKVCEYIRLNPARRLCRL